MKVEEEVTTEVVADVYPVETVEALEGTEAEEAKKVRFLEQRWKLRR